VWENIRPVRVPPDVTVIAGNSEAAAIHHTDYILPQVGIDPDLFRPMPEVEKEYDFVFVGRDTPEKGVYYVRNALEELDVSVLWREEFLEYDQVPTFLNRAKCQLCPSIDTWRWKEQAGSYSNVESLFCGLSVITSDSAAIVEWLKGCPGVTFVPQKDADALRDAMKDGGKLAPPEAREWVMKRYSNEVVAKKLIKILEEVSK
jgi:glycosyltransferase involved in cell wall biosynthesis